MIVDVVECSVNTCKSGGTCVEKIGGGTTCICPEGYTEAENCCPGKPVSLLVLFTLSYQIVLCHTLIDFCKVASDCFRL